MADSMFEGVSIFDAAANENTGIRDRALNVAQLGRGRVGVYGSALAGGMVTRGLAGMAGMKTQEEEKAETISSILQETKGLDRNDPKNLLVLAQKFANAGMPEVAQRFYQKSRDLTKELRDATRQDELLKVEQEKAAAATSQAATAAYTAETGRTSVENQTMIALKTLDFEEFKYMDESGLDLYKHNTSLALSQQIADNNLELGKDQNVISAVNAGVNYYLSRLKPEEIAVSKMIAENAQRQTVVDAYYKAGSLLYQNAALKSQNDVNAYNQSMGGDLTNVLLPNGQSGVGQMVWDPETQTASFKLVSTGEAGGELTDILATGTAAQIQDAMVTASGITSEEQSVVKNVTKAYETIFKTGVEFGPQFGLPTEPGQPGYDLFSDEGRAKRGLEPLTEVPSLLEYARYLGMTPGQTGYDPDYENSDQWKILSKGHGKSFANLYDTMVDSERYKEQEVSAEKKSEIMAAYPMISNVELLDTVVDLPVINGKDYPPMSLANAIQALNAHTWDEYKKGTLQVQQFKMTGDNINIAVQRLIENIATNQAEPAVQPVVQSVAETNDAITQVAPIVPEVTEEPVVETTGFDAMVKALPINTTRTEANKNGRTYYESPEFDTSTKEGREEKKKYDQWRFKNVKKYRLQGIELPTSKIKRS